jgi:transcription-repair coupling factor (superfamily II helicase)
MLPPDYIAQPEIRLGIYRRLAKATDQTEIEALREEIADRFGPLPAVVEQLVDSHLARVMAGALGVSAIIAGPQAIALEFGNGRAPHVEAGGNLYWKGDRLICKRQGDGAGDSSRGSLLELLSELA